MSLADLGETFKRARLVANKTQQQVAEETGTARSRISMFETGALPELGLVKVLSLFESVGLELFARPVGHGRTLDDVLTEAAASATSIADTRLRVRHSRQRYPSKAGAVDTSPAGHNPLDLENKRR